MREAWQRKNDALKMVSKKWPGDAAEKIYPREQESLVTSWDSLKVIKVVYYTAAHKIMLYKQVKILRVRLLFLSPPF